MNCCQDGEELGMSRWEEVYGNVEERAWARYISNPFKPDTLKRWWNDALTKIGWSSEGNKIPRKAAWFVSKGCSCPYKYAGTVWKPNTFPNWLTEITCEVMKIVGWPSKIKTLPNSCNANLYEDGNDFVAWHSDDETLFNSKHEDCTIISLSLGATRNFEILHKKSKKTWKKALKNGDILTMEGMFQKFLKHQITKDSRVHDYRINLTLRWIRKHDQASCTQKA